MEKRWFNLVNLFLLHLFFYLFLAYNYVFIPFFKIPNTVVFLVIVGVMILSFILIREMLRLADKEKEVETIGIRLEEAKKLVTTLRSKHHDFVNHLQVIMGLIQMKRENDAIMYIKGLSKDLVQIEKLVALERPEVAALISAKLASVSYIRVSLDINSKLTELSVPPEKLTSILGNIIDNAIYETSHHNDKWVAVRIQEEEDWYVFEITNPGNIPCEIQQKIFEPGFTTKAEKGTGLGLFVVKNLVKECGGSVTFNSETGEVKFAVKLPRVSKKPSIAIMDRGLQLTQK